MAHVRIVAIRGRRVAAVCDSADGSHLAESDAREMDRRDGEPERLKALVEGQDWAAFGQREGEIGVDAAQELAA